MGKQKEGSLQERIQTLVERRGGYCFKNHGDMTTEPGRPDIICCYKGIFVAIEAKVDNNTPSRQQGIHCRKIWKAGGIACIVWSTDDVETVLNLINYYLGRQLCPVAIVDYVHDGMLKMNIDDGTRW